MDIALKNEIADRIIQSNDDLLLNEIKSLVGLSDADFWASLPEEVRQAVNKAKTQLDNGEGISHSQVMDQVRDRFLK